MSPTSRPHPSPVGYPSTLPGVARSRSLAACPRRSPLPTISAMAVGEEYDVTASANRQQLLDPAPPLQSVEALQHALRPSGDKRETRG